MNFKMTQIAALTALAFASTGAHAVLDGATMGLTIDNDAVTTFGLATASATTSSWYVSSNGAALDSFFTMGGAKTKDALNTQYAYLTGGQTLTLNGATQANTAGWTYYGAPGINKTAGVGISVISTSGDTAMVNLSGWKVDWNGVNDVYMGSYSWGTGAFPNGQAKVTCATGSGCAVGSAYTLKYTATVPTASQPEFTAATGFEGVKYYLELHGTVAAVPEASTYGMMLAGLGLVGFAVRRRKSVI